MEIMIAGGSEGPTVTGAVGQQAARSGEGSTQLAESGGGACKW